MFYVFYADRLYTTYPMGTYPRGPLEMGPEIYNGGYTYSDVDHKWYRCDLTPVLPEDVPKTLQTILLLMF